MSIIKIPMEMEIKLVGFEKELYKAIRQHINAALFDSIPEIESETQRLFDNRIRASKEYKSLTSGLLRKDLGLENPADNLEEIIEVAKEGIKVTYTPMPAAYGGVGGISVNMIRSGYKDLLSLGAAKYISHGKDGSYLIEWLNWMLTEGDNVIVDDYIVAYGNFQASRTGEAIMFKRPGGVYKIPSQFSGVPGKNFLTRAIRDTAPEFTKIFEKALKRNL